MNKWKICLHDYMAFSYTLNMTINNENYIEKLVDFEIEIFELGNKFGVYRPIPLCNNKFEFDEFISEYRAYREHDIKYTNFDYIYLLSYYELPYYQNNILAIGMDIGEINSNIEEQNPQENRIKKDYSEILEISPDLMLRNDFYPDCYEEKQISFSLNSYSNIWLDEIEPTLQYDSYFYGRILDNRETANLITPKFNSFLKYIKEYLENCEGSISLDESSYNQVTPEGILIDGTLKFEETIHNKY